MHWTEPATAGDSHSDLESRFGHLLQLPEGVNLGECVNLAMRLSATNRIPELQITNPELKDEIYQVIDEAGLDDDREGKLKQVLGKSYA